MEHAGPGVLLLRGSPGDVGRAHGDVCRPAVRANVATFRRAVTDQGHDLRAVRRAAVAREGLFPAHRLEEVEGIARGAGLTYPDVLAYQCFQQAVSPDECTVAFAIGKAAASGDTVFFKNSDKVGGATLIGPNFHRMKEINVLLALQAPAGHWIIGPSAAGSTGLKMAVSSAGVVAGANISRTEALFAKRLDLTSIRAIDRAQLLREALEQTTALAACQDTVAKILANPMATPGNLEYADARVGYVIEGSYTEIAQETIRDDVGGRSNRFVLLKALNAWHDISSQARYTRLLEFLRPRKGHVTFADMLALSVDHWGGPGPNSICRHGQTPEEEVSLSSMVVALDGVDPRQSRIAFALGKPCHAWRHREGQIHLTLDFRPADLPPGFTNGDVWKRFYQEAPMAGPLTAAPPGADR